MPTRIKTHTAATEQERQQLLSAAAALRTAATRQTPWRCSVAGSVAKIPNDPTNPHRGGICRPTHKHEQRPRRENGGL